TLFEYPRLKDLAQQLKQQWQGDGAKDIPVAPTTASDSSALSPAQQVFWTQHQSVGDTGLGNVQMALRIDGPLDQDALNYALQAVAARHPALQTRFIETNGVVTAQRDDTACIPFARLDLQDEAMAEALTKAEAVQPFDLSCAPLCRAQLLTLGPDSTQLVLTAHHIICDGWSAGLLWADLATAYDQHCREGSATLEPLAATIHGLAHNPAHTPAPIAPSLPSNKTGDEATAPPALALPTDRPRGAQLNPQAGNYQGQIPAPLWHQINSFAQANGSTPYVVLMAGLQVLLSKHTGQEDFAIGSPVSTRRDVADEQAVGCLIDTMVLRSDLPTHSDFHALVAAVKTTVLTAQQASLEKTITDGLLSTPAFEVLFTVQNMPGALPRLGDARINDVTPLPQRVAQDLAFVLSPTETSTTHGVDALITYREDLFDHQRIMAFWARYLTLLDHLLRKPSAAWRTMDVRLANEVHENDHPALSQDGETILDLIDARQQQAPGDPVILSAGHSTTYGALWARAEHWAHAIRQNGVRQGDIVAVILPRSAEAITAQLAILRAGAAFVSLDPEHPIGRLKPTLNAADTCLVITDDHQILSSVDKPMVTPAALDGGPGDTRMFSPLPVIRPDDLAYLVFTSGSTGQPKPVAIEHQGLPNLALAHSKLFDLQPSKRMLNFASPAFDAAIGETLIPLATGAAIAIPNATERQPGAPLEGFIDRAGVTTVTLVPSLLAALDPTAVPGLSTVVAMGEACPPGIIERWHTPNRRVINAYGPAEATVCATAHIATGPHDQPAIGLPLPGVIVRVLDAHGTPVPPGVTGSLWLGGIGLARGYLNLPAETAARFMPSPDSAALGTHANTRLYDTGDQVQQRTDGSLLFMGRRDNQLSINGVRVEPGEIEALLTQEPGILEATVLRHEGQGRPRLVGFVRRGDVAQDQMTDHGAPDTNAILDRLSQTLPAALVPTQLVVLNDFPRTPNGKLDHEALHPLVPTLNDQDAIDPAQDGPRGEAEKAVHDAWARTLNYRIIGRDQNFFALGGDSIAVIEVANWLKKAGWSVPVRGLFEHPTIAGLSTLITRADNSDNAAVDASQPLPDGPLPLSAMQRWFLSHNPPVPNHFTQSLVLECHEDIPPADLHAALTRALSPHAVFKLCFSKRESGWQQTLRSDQHAPLLAWIEASANETITALATKLRRQLSLTHGPLIGAALTGRHLILIAHHFVVDGVSWRLLLDSLARELTTPGEASASSDTMALHAAIEEDQRKRGTKADASDPGKAALNLPLSQPDASNCFGDQVTVQGQLSKADTQRLLHHTHHAYGTNTEDVLFAASTEALSTWHQQPALTVDLERHGRDQGDLDLTQAVGWFTRFDQTVINTSSLKGDLPSHLVAAKEARATAIASDPVASRAPVVINYMGDTRISGEALPFSLTTLDTGPDTAADNPRLHEIELNARLDDGRLTLDLNFASPRINPKAMGEVMGHCLTTLRQLISHCEAQAVALLTPSDLPHATIDWAGLQALHTRFGPLTTAYDPGPLQAGMLLDQLRDPSSRATIEQLSCRLDGPLDPDRFWQAWRDTAAAIPALRACFNPDPASPLIVVPETVEWPCETLDWRAVPAHEHDQKLDDLMAAERVRGFTLDDAPMHRLTLIQRQDEAWHFVWTNDHLLLDGWSLPLVLDSVFARYRGTTPPKIVDQADYLTWRAQHGSDQQGQGRDSFWRDYLAGFTTANDLPFTANTNAAGTMPGHISRPLSQAMGEGLRLQARQHGVTLAAQLLSAWALVLAQQSGQRDVVTGLTVSGRPASVADADRMVGMFINTLPVRIDCQTDQSVTAFLAATHQTMGALVEGTGDALSAITAAASDFTGDRLFHSTLVVENYPVEEGLLDALPGIRVSNVQAIEDTHFPLTLLVSPGETITVKALYDRSLFDGSTVFGLLSQFEFALGAFAAGAGAGSGSVSCVGDVALDDGSGLVAGRGPVAAWPAGCLLDGVADQVAC
ncbi:MAG: amino acid adenylation domain-containing protein, partial [Pseudomonadota bacterium]